jgi:hypothetical protein
VAQGPEAALEIFGTPCEDILVDGEDNDNIVTYPGNATRN